MHHYSVLEGEQRSWPVSVSRGHQHKYLKNSHVTFLSLHSALTDFYSHVIRKLHNVGCSEKRWSVPPPPPLHHATKRIKYIRYNDHHPIPSKSRLSTYFPSSWYYVTGHKGLTTGSKGHVWTWLTLHY
jgi:hypothetical protein